MFLHSRGELCEHRVTSCRDTDRWCDSEVVCGDRVIYVHVEYGYTAITRTVSAAVATDTILYLYGFIAAAACCNMLMPCPMP